jgi:hypothetical protein
MNCFVGWWGAFSAAPPPADKLLTTFNDGFDEAYFVD